MLYQLLAAMIVAFVSTALMIRLVVALRLVDYPKGRKQDVEPTPINILRLSITPLVDIAYVIWRRSQWSRWPVNDDRKHLHYMRIDRWYATEQVFYFLVTNRMILKP
jgi:UDP-N-acetylmuramyl pentapeptide phosphotransferase/UDP-N-acetylglucosamine-1-phosphate transferase